MRFKKVSIHITHFKKYLLDDLLAVDSLAELVFATI